jgi:hypothetical protein
LHDVLSGGHEVRLRKILSFEQKRFSHRFGKGVRKAVTVIQSGAVPSFAEIHERLTRQIGLLFGDGLDTD